VFLFTGEAEGFSLAAKLKKINSNKLGKRFDLPVRPSGAPRSHKGRILENIINQRQGLAPELPDLVLAAAGSAPQRFDFLAFFSLPEHVQTRV